VSEYLESKLEIERWHRSVPANIMMNTALLFIYDNCLQKHGHMTQESKWLPDLKEVGEGQQEDSGHGVPVEDEDGGAGALVEGRLGEYVHAGVDQPDEHHGGVNLAVAHGGCWINMVYLSARLLLFLCLATASRPYIYATAMATYCLCVLRRISLFITVFL
jgi:hypothetical protein